MFALPETDSHGGGIAQQNYAPAAEAPLAAEENTRSGSRKRTKPEPSPQPEGELDPKLEDCNDEVVELCDVCGTRPAKQRKKQCGTCGADVQAARAQAKMEGKESLFKELYKKKGS